MPEVPMERMGAFTWTSSGQFRIIPKAEAIQILEQAEKDAKKETEENDLPGS